MTPSTQFVYQTVQNKGKKKEYYQNHYILWIKKLKQYNIDIMICCFSNLIFSYIENLKIKQIYNFFLV